VPYDRGIPGFCYTELVKPWFLLLLCAPAWGLDCGQTVTKKGVYTLSRSCTGEIRVQANGVSINLAGKTLRCGQNRFGVYAPGVSGLRVYGGRITGCFTGLHAPLASRVLVDTVDFTGNRYIGLTLGGSGNAIRNSTFADISGYPASGYAVGINAPGPNCSITRNTFRNLYKQSTAFGEGVGILLRSGKCTVQHNWMENETPDMNIGIWIARQASAVIRENVITNFGRAIVGAPGSEIYAVDNRLVLKQPLPGSVGISGTGMSAGNVIVGFETPVTVPSYGDLH